MATKFNLKIETPVGTFTRKATRQYTHAVVHQSPRAMTEFLAMTSPDATEDQKRWAKSGVTGRWVKDRGYAVTWHSTEAAARKAAAAPYGWDGSVAKIGIFAVEA